jgi:hypothetical protein
MRLGTIRYLAEYVVDLDNAEMVENARDAVIEDVQIASERPVLAGFIQEIITGNERAEQIPAFLTEDVEEED